VIYNSVPLFLLKDFEEVKKLGMKSLRLSFTTESRKETEETVGLYIDRYLYGRSTNFTGEYTKGHFKRGIE
jgi:putative protease